MPRYVNYLSRGGFVKHGQAGAREARGEQESKGAGGGLAGMLTVPQHSLREMVLG